MAATSLGNPSDIPARSIEALRTADVLVFEEDRPARSFLKAAGIHRSYLKYSEHDERETMKEVAAALGRGEVVVYMSDQGTAGWADPGRRLVQTAYELGAEVISIPGPSAVASAIAACPFQLSEFRYLGFLPREGTKRQARLREFHKSNEVLILMDTPYRKQALLADCARVLGQSRSAFLAVDISGERESFRVGKLGELARNADKSERLNFVLIIDGASSP